MLLKMCTYTVVNCKLDQQLLLVSQFERSQISEKAKFDHCSLKRNRETQEAAENAEVCNRCHIHLLSCGGEKVYFLF